MNRFILLVLAIVAAPASGLAQNAPAPQAAVADPAAPVPAPRYHPALAPDGRPPMQDRTDWKAANAQVGQFTRGHSDLLKWEQTQGAAPPAAGPGRGMPLHDMPRHRH